MTPLIYVLVLGGLIVGGLFGFAGPAALIALPIVLVVAAGLGIANRGRDTGVQELRDQADDGQTEFTARDKETLT